MKIVESAHGTSEDSGALARQRAALDEISRVELDRFHPVPLYHQFAEAISKLIRNRVLVPGDRLPAERDLAELVGMSRMTARQALAQLERNGDIVVRHGIGTFVSSPKVTYDALHLQGFTESASADGFSVSTRVVRLEIVDATPEIASQLELAAGAKVVKIARKRFVDQTPLLFETSFLPADRFASLIEEDLSTNSLYGLLERQFRVRLTHADESIEAGLAGDEAEHLDLPAHQPVLVLSGVAFEGSLPVEVFRSVYLADRVRLTISSTRDRGVRGERTPRVSMVLV
ncbi:MAG: GntR family transcriptional regulator [Thermomicrobiales bacterium]